MKSLTEHLWFEIPGRRSFVNITHMVAARLPRTSRVLWVIPLAILLIWGSKTLLPDRPSEVPGLSKRDIAQIRKLCHREMWRWAFPPGSTATLKHSPNRLWSFWRDRLTPPTQWDNVSGKPTMYNNAFGFYPDDCWMVFTTEVAIAVHKVKGRWKAFDHDSFIKNGP